VTERTLPTGYRICAACGQGSVAPGRPCPNCGAGIGAAPVAPVAPAKPALFGMVPCRAHGGRPGGECYYSLAMDPPCGETPCMIEPGPVVGGVKTYRYRIHPLRCTGWPLGQPVRKGQHEDDDD